MKLELPPIPETERTPLVVALLAIIDAQQLRWVPCNAANSWAVRNVTSQ